MGPDDRVPHGAPAAVSEHPRFQPGDVVVERGVFFDRIVIARPLTVVEHTGPVLATTLAIGTHYFGALPTSRETIYEELARGDLMWGERTWVDNNVLVLARPDDPYSVMGFWNESGAFVGWYINLQDPLRWTRFGYDTRDHALDLIIGEDLASFMWKDEHELEMSVDFGLYTADEATAFRRNGEAVIELMERGDVWWSQWRDWAPDPSQPIPTLPDGWDVV